MAGEEQEGKTHISQMGPADVSDMGSQLGVSWVSASQRVASRLDEKFGFLFIG